MNNTRIPPEGYCYVEGDLRHRTNQALLLFDGKRAVWIPLSQIEDEEDLGNGRIELLIKLWLAEEKGLI